MWRIGIVKKIIVVVCISLAMALTLATPQKAKGGNAICGDNFICTGILVVGAAIYYGVKTAVVTVSMPVNIPVQAAKRKKYNEEQQADLIAAIPYAKKVCDSGEDEYQEGSGEHFGTFMMASSICHYPKFINYPRRFYCMMASEKPGYELQLNHLQTACRIAALEDLEEGNEWKAFTLTAGYQPGEDILIDELAEEWRETDLFKKFSHRHKTGPIWEWENW